MSNAPLISPYFAKLGSVVLKMFIPNSDEKENDSVQEIITLNITKERRTSRDTNLKGNCCLTRFYTISAVSLSSKS